MAFNFMGCRALTHNNAETRPDHADPSLRTRTYTLDYDVFFSRVLKVIEGLPRWEVVQSDREMGAIQATRQTRLFRFIDDVHVQMTKKGEEEVTVNLRSASRVGKGDFGQNARNIRELLKSLE